MCPDLSGFAKKCHFFHDSFYRSAPPITFYENANFIIFCRLPYLKMSVKNLLYLYFRLRLTWFRLHIQLQKTVYWNYKLYWNFIFI